MIESINNLKYEQELYEKGYKNIAGLDEVGRGPMAGPVVVACVVLDKNDIIKGLTDSKLLSKNKRNELTIEIKKRAIDYSITFIDADEVDEINVYQASKLGMIKCLEKMDVDVDYILTDAMPLPYDNCLSLIKGDLKSASIAAASIIAKVARDSFMEELAIEYPCYGFEKHKGYCTKLHKEALKKYGVIDHVHRKSFKPVQDVLHPIEQQKLF